jgi:hypothetical protein
MSVAMDIAVDSVVKAIPRMIELYEEIKSKANGKGIAGAVGNALLGPFGRKAAEKALDKVDDVIQEFKKIVEERGSAQDIRGAAGEWNALVLNTVRDKAGVLDQDKDKIGADDNWTGSARDAYVSATGGQRESLNKLAGVVEELGKILHETASAHNTYWVGIAGTAALFVGSLGVAAVTVEFPPAAAAALAAALAAGAGLAAFMTAFENTLNEKANAMDNQKTTLNQILGDGSTWPKAVNDNPGDPRSLSDASVTDGDASEWVPVP